MRIALDSSVLVGYFVDDDPLHDMAMQLMEKNLNGEIEYACVSKITIAELGYVIERKMSDAGFTYNCMHSTANDLALDVIDVTWEFILALAHLKAVNVISFCDNATLTAAKLTNGEAIFSKEKEIVLKAKDKLHGAGIIFLDEFPF